MREVDRNKAWGFTLFADDFRMELAGKVSIIGLYQADMILPDQVSFPVSIPKLCVFIMYYEAKDSITSDITFRVTFESEEKPIVEVPILRKDLVDLPAAAADDPAEDRERIFHSRIPIMLTPFTIPSPGRLRVRACYSDGVVLKLGSMAVRQVSAEEFSRVVSSSPLEGSK